MTSSEASAGRWRRPSLSGSVGLIALALLAGALLARAYPQLLSALWTCNLKALTGLPCLSCGLTRVLLHFASGEPLAAFALAPLPALAIVLSLALGVWQLLARWRRTPLPDDVLGRWLSRRGVRWGALVSVLALWGYAIARSLATGAP